MQSRLRFGRVALIGVLIIAASAILFAAALAVFAWDEYADPDPPTNAAEVRAATSVPAFGGAGGRQYSDAGLIDLPGFFGPAATGEWRSSGVLLTSWSGS